MHILLPATSCCLPNASSLFLDICALPYRYIVQGAPGTKHRLGTPDISEDGGSTSGELEHLLKLVLVSWELTVSIQRLEGAPSHPRTHGGWHSRPRHCQCQAAALAYDMIHFWRRMVCRQIVRLALFFSEHPSRQSLRFLLSKPCGAPFAEFKAVAPPLQVQHHRVATCLTQTSPRLRAEPAEWCRALPLPAAAPLVGMVQREVVRGQPAQQRRGRRGQPTATACHEAPLHLAAWAVILARQAAEEVRRLPLASGTVASLLPRMHRDIHQACLPFGLIHLVFFSARSRS